MLQEFRYAIRVLIREKKFSIVVILTLALGIGACTAMFSFVNALLLSHPPYKDSDRLVRITSQRGSEAGMLSIREIYDLREQAKLFEGFASMRNTQYNVTGDGPPEALTALVNTHNLFELLGVQPLLGETWPRSHEGQVVFEIVISYDLWMSRYGGDKAIIGKSIMLDGAPYKVLAVMPPGFNFPLDAQLYRRVPHGDIDSRSIRESSAIARLQPGVSLAQAQAELSAIASRWQQLYPDTNAGLQLSLSPFRENYIGGARTYLLLMMGAVFFVLLIACVNAVNLMLARALAREQEIAIRVALGATRATLLRQMLVETILIAGTSGLIGFAISLCGVNIITRMVRLDLPPWMKITVDWRLLTFTFSISLIAALMVGLLPALRASTPRLSECINRGSRGASARMLKSGGRQFLVISQVALALVLLAGAGLLVKSFAHLQKISLGFNPSHLLTLKIDPPWFKYKLVSQSAPFYRRVVDEVLRIPGVEAASFNDSLPLAGKDVREGANRLTIEIEGQGRGEQQKNPYVNAQIVSYGYFAALNIPLFSGRYFDSRDRQGTVPVALISERTARRFWPTSDPIGRRFKLTGRPQNYRPDGGDQDDPWMTVVGVVGNVRQRGVMSPPGLDVYVCDQQLFSPESYLSVRTQLPALALVPLIKQAVWRVDPEQSVFDVRLMEERVSKTVWQQQLAGTIFVIFASFALLLAAVGIYGVMSYIVSQRTREFGIRLALGAQPRSVLRLVLVHGMTLIGTGVIVGSLGFVAFARSLGSVLYEVKATDPLTLAVVTIILAAAGLVACYVPARRVAYLDPLLALRDE